MANGQNGGREFRVHRLVDFGINAAISSALVIIIGYIMIIPTLKTEFDYMKRDMGYLRSDLREWTGKIGPQREQSVADFAEIKTRLTSIELRMSQMESRQREKEKR